MSEDHDLKLGQSCERVLDETGGERAHRPEKHHADHLEICAQLISHKQHQKTLAQIMAQMGVQQNVTSVHWRVGEA